jgi:hypothetical protein
MESFTTLPIELLFGSKNLLFIKLPSISAIMPAIVNLIPANRICVAVPFAGILNNL